MSNSMPALRRVPDELPPAQVAPGLTPRLVVDTVPLTLSAEQSLGYLNEAPTRAAAVEMVDELSTAGLQGRGGSGFPAYVKWRSISIAEGETVVVANGHEGEPASGKDRWLMLHRPFMVLHGLMLAALAAGARRAIVVVSRDDTETAMRDAIGQVVSAGLVPEGIDLEVFRSVHRYVAGEETSLVRAINGGPALPTAKPPRPYEKGVDERPTLIQNVETLAHAAWIHINGAAAFLEEGTRNSPGTALFTILDHHGDCTLIEAPLGMKLIELVELAGIDHHEVARVLLGGWFGGVHGQEVLGLEACFTALKVAGSGLGCASITLLGVNEDVRAIVAALGAWYADETANQCGVCRNGTKSIAKALFNNANGQATDTDLENLARWGTTLTGRGACAFIDGAATLARTTVAVISSKQFMEPRAD